MEVDSHKRFKNAPSLYILFNYLFCCCFCCDYDDFVLLFFVCLFSVVWGAGGGVFWGV